MTRLRMISAVVATALVGMLAVEKAGALSISVASPPALTYSPDTIVSTKGSFTVRSDGYKGNFCIVLAQLSLTAGSPEGLSYGLYKPADNPTYALSLDGTPASADEVLLGNFPSGSSSNSTVTLDFAVLVFPKTLPPVNTYWARLIGRVYRGSYPPSGQPDAYKTFWISVTVGSHFDVAIVASGSSFGLASTNAALDFGSLAPNVTRSLDLLVRSNIAYDLSIASTKGGILANSLDAASSIAYEFRANDSLLTLAAGLPSSIASHAAATYSAPFRYGLAVKIKPYTSMPTEGNYSDSLTVTLAAP